MCNCNMYILLGVVICSGRCHYHHRCVPFGCGTINDARTLLQGTRVKSVELEREAYLCVIIRAHDNRRPIVLLGGVPLIPLVSSSTAHSRVVCAEPRHVEHTRRTCCVGFSKGGAKKTTPVDRSPMLVGHVSPPFSLSNLHTTPPRSHPSAPTHRTCFKIPDAHLPVHRSRPGYVHNVVRSNSLH